MFHHASLEVTMPGIVPQIQMYSICSILCFPSQTSNCGWSSTQTMRWLCTWFQRCGCSLSSWTAEGNFSRLEGTLVKLVRLCPAFGSGSIPAHTLFQTCVRCLTGFAACTRTGFYGQWQKVQGSTVSSAVIAIGQMISTACNDNPTKVVGSEKFPPSLQVI